MRYVVHIYIRFDELTVKVDFLLVYYEHKASEYQVFQWFEFSLPLLWLVNSKFLRTISQEFWIDQSEKRLEKVQNLIKVQILKFDVFLALKEVQFFDSLQGYIIASI